MKYVMVTMAEFKWPIIFPDALSHGQFAGVQGARIVSAGYITPLGEPYGEAVSLRDLKPKCSKPRRGDDIIIKTFLAGEEAKLHMLREQNFK